MVWKYFFSFFLAQLITCQTLAQSPAPKFKRLTSSEGLSQDHVSSILKDRMGFMWFATDDGLNKYDGYKFTIYKHDSENSQSISSNTVVDIYEDQAGNLWVGTVRGLDRFDRKREIFIHYKPENSTLSIRDIFEDSKNRIWIGTTNGLYLFNEADNSFTPFRNDTGDEFSISHDFVYRICEFTENELWVATREGLNRFDVDQRKFYRYKYDPLNKQSIGANRIKTVFKSTDNNIWIGMQGGGIALYNRLNNSFINFKNEPGNKNSISHNDVLSMAEDKNGILWVGTENGGISLFNYRTKTWKTFQHDIVENSSLSNNSVYCIYRDDINNMWVGTWSGGVNFLPNFGDKFQHFKKIPGDENSLSNNIVLSIDGDEDGNIWIGTDGGGINKIDWSEKKFTHYLHGTRNENTPNANYVLCITSISKDVLGIGYHRGGFDFFNHRTGRFTHHMPKDGSLTGLSVHVVFKDTDGNIWVGTYDRNGLYLYDPSELFRYDKKQGRYIHYRSNPQDNKSLGGTIVYCMYEDKDENLWVGTNGGLDRFDKKTNEFVHHRFTPGVKATLSNDIVYSITEDSAGNLWIGTGGGGLNVFDKKTQTFKAFTEKDGLNNNVIYGVLEDDLGNLWLSSNRGLSKFNPITKSLRNYGINDGLQSNSFKPNAYYKNKNGEMFFGGANGFNVFHPDSIKENTFVPPVWITGLQIFNKPVEIGRESPLSENISQLKSIELSYEQSVFTFEFAALNYTSPEVNEYAYMLEGFDKDWNYVGNKRTATYTNLNAGEYTFKVKGSNNDGVWNDKGATIKVIITPPFWKTWWFRSLLVFSIITAAFTFYRVRIATIQKQKLKLKRKVRKRTQKIMKMNEEIKSQAKEITGINENLELLVKKRTAELERQNKALEEYAFINAHKVRGPVASILGLINLLSKHDLPPESTEILEHLDRSAMNLDSIVHTVTKAIEQGSDSAASEHNDVPEKKSDNEIR
jgi:ligand-binding sensor domain-containing protein